MTASGAPPPPRDLSPVARACGAIGAALGALILVGWLLEVGLLTNVVPSLPAAMPNSALMFVACGVALVVEGSTGCSRRLRAVAVACCLFVVAVAGATLVEHATGADLGIDRPLGGEFGGGEHPGRPATHTAAAFLLLGCCLLATRWRGRVGDAVAGVLGAGTAAAIGLAVAGYLIGVPYLYGTSSDHGMSAHTAAGLVVVLTGVFALRPSAPPASWYAGSGGGELAARRLMGPGLLIPFVAGALAQAGANAGLYDERFALSLLVVLAAALIQGLIYLAVSAVRGHEAVREALERDRRETVRRFMTLARHAPVGIFEADSTGAIIFVSERWSEISGMSPGEAVSGSIANAVHPDDRERVRRDWRAAAAAGRAYEDEFRFERPDGEARWVTAHAAPLRDETGRVTGFLGTVLDITERRTAEEQTALVVDRIAEAVSIIGSDGVHLHTNPAAHHILEDLEQRYQHAAVGELPWNAVRTDGTTVPNDQLPAEVTRLTGREIDEAVLGFPGAGGSVRWLRISTRRLSDEAPPYTVVASYSDVTAEREDQARLAEAQERFRLAFEDAPIGVALVAPGGRLLRVNRALSEMTGYDPNELLAMSYQDITHPDDLDAEVEQLSKMVAGGARSHEMEKRYSRADGSTIWVHVSVSLVRGDEGKPLYFIAQVLDVTERLRLERKLRHLAEHDALTGLANRRVFNAELARVLAIESRYGGESALLMVDLDNFKGINDTMGHATGDLVLQATAYVLRERVRDSDVVARLGGDEFAILLPNTTREGAEVLAADLVEAVRALDLQEAGRPVSVTASVGVVTTGELPVTRNEDTVMAAADLAMYEAKRGGRDRYTVHDGR